VLIYRKIYIFYKYLENSGLIYLLLLTIKYFFSEIYHCLMLGGEGGRGGVGVESGVVVRKVKLRQGNDTWSSKLRTESQESYQDL